VYQRTVAECINFSNDYQTGHNGQSLDIFERLESNHLTCNDDIKSITCCIFMYTNADG
jgi:hypothetical protein